MLDLETTAGDTRLIGDLVIDAEEQQRLESTLFAPWVPPRGMQVHADDQVMQIRTDAYLASASLRKATNLDALDEEA